MGIRRQKELPGDVKRVKARIEHWRKTREKRTAMPKRLWESAVSLARVHGVYWTARILGLSYESLNRRVIAEGGNGAGMQKGYPGFVDIGSTQLMGMTQPMGPVVEFSRADGTKLVFRLTDSTELDISSVVEAFWSHVS